MYTVQCHCPYRTIASLKGYVDVVHVLIEAHADIHMEVVQLLVQSGTLVYTLQQSNIQYILQFIRVCVYENVLQIEGQ